MPAHTISQDLKYAFRGLRRNSSFTAVAVLTMALGIGLNTALFTVFDSFVLKPLPLRDPSTLVSLEGRDKDGRRQRLFSYLDYLELRHESAAFSDLVAWNKVSATLGEAPPQGDDDFLLAEGYEHLFGQIVSTNYFTALGARMHLGRGFNSNEDTPGESSAVVLGHAYWRSRLNSDASVIGRSLMLQGRQFTVVGVAEPSFTGTTPDPPSFWIPLQARDELIQTGGWGFKTWLTDRDVEVFTLLGRLAPNVSSSQAEAAVQLTLDRLAEMHPKENRKTSVELLRAGTFVTLDEDLWALVLPLAIGFGLVLLVACANVANLLLARALGREREIGVRIALGAQRSRVVRQLLTESILLAVLGGVAGLMFSFWALRLAYPIILSSLPVPELATGLALNLSPDWRIFTFTFAVAAVTGAVAGLAPAIQFSRPDVVTALKDETSQGYLSKSRLRSGLVVVQVAVSLSLLIAAALLLSSARRLQRVDTGMNTRNVFAIAVAPLDATSLKRDLSNRLRALPDVVSVSDAFNKPLSGNLGKRLVRIERGETLYSHECGFNLVSAEYFQTLSIPILRGRPFSSEEVWARVPVVVVSETASKEFWPGQDPIGQRISVQAETGNPQNARYDVYEVVGVAHDTRSRHLWQKDGSFIYMPVSDTSSRYLLVQTRSSPKATMADVRGLAAEIDPKLRTSVAQIDRSVGAQTLPFRALAWLSAVLGGLALLLASLGLYGVTSFVVARRTHEIGIRMALGAQRRDVIALFLRGGLRLTAVGILLGLLGGAALSRLLVSVLVDLSPLDAFVFAVVSIFLFTVSAVAILAATRCATKVDPLVALRYE